MPNSLTEKNENHVIVLVHGIRDFAYWQVEIRQSLEAHGFAVELTNYERFDLVRFLAPIPWFRNTVIEKIWKQIEQIYQLHPGKKISFIAHSFGTYVLAEIMQRKFNFVANRIIFCGSVARYDAPLEQITNRFEPPLLNEVGTRDIWPAIAQSLTFGYGSAGSYGFKRPNVRDRWHAHADHGYFLNSEFCTRFWVPFLEDGKIVPAENKPQQPSWWVRLIYIVQIKFIVVGFIGLLAYLIPWQRLNSYPVEQWVVVAEEARRAGTVHASRPMPNTLVQARSAFEAWWNDTGFKGRKALPADLVYKALTYNARLYRIFERQDEMKPNSNYWNEQCLSYFEQIQNSDKVTECLLDMSALYLDLSQIQHTNPDNFRAVP